MGNTYETLTVSVPLCACGRPAKSRCGDIPNFTVTPCKEPVCGDTGLPACQVHRHREGTMGYMINTSVRAELKAFTPDGPGPWHWLKTFCANRLTSAQWKANRTLRDHCNNYPPPAPLPRLTLVVAGVTFTSNPFLTAMVPTK